MFVQWISSNTISRLWPIPCLPFGSNQSNHITRHLLEPGFLGVQFDQRWNPELFSYQTMPFDVPFLSKWCLIDALNSSYVSSNSLWASGPPGLSFSFELPRASWAHLSESFAPCLDWQFTNWVIHFASSAFSEQVWHSQASEYHFLAWWRKACHDMIATVLWFHCSHDSVCLWILPVCSFADCYPFYYFLAFQPARRWRSAVSQALG